MNVIFHPAYLMHEDAFFFANACQIALHPGLQLLGDELAPILGAEYNVNDVLNVCVGQCVAPPALYILHVRLPTAGAVG